MENIYHICRRSLWEKSRPESCYIPLEYDAEGFIHCSTQKQLINVANTYYQDVQDLVVLEIKPNLVDAEIRWETADGDKYPHIYGSLNTDSVLGVKLLIRDDKGYYYRVG